VQNIIMYLFFMPRRSNFGEVRVTHKRGQCNAKKRAFLRALPSESNFDELAPTILKSFFQKKKRQFVVFYLAYSYICSRY